MEAEGKSETQFRLDEEYGIRYIKGGVAPTAEMARAGIGIPVSFTSVRRFDRLLDPIAAARISPAAKLVAARITTYSFRWEEKVDRNERSRGRRSTEHPFFFGIRSIAKHTGLSPSNVSRAIGELVRFGLLAKQPAGIAAHVRGREKYVLLRAPDLPWDEVDDGIRTPEFGDALTASYSLRQNFIPLYSGEQINPAYVQSYLRIANEKSWAGDAILLGLVERYALPIFEWRTGLIAQALAMDPNTVRAGLLRLQDLSLIAKSDSGGWYLCANPAFAKRCEHGEIEVAKLLDLAMHRQIQRKIQQPPTT